MFDIRAFAEAQIKEEGHFSDDPDDSGGATCWGVTEVTARAFGYEGDMRYLPYETAVRIFIERYYEQPHFDWVSPLSNKLAKKLVEIGINMGQSRAGSFMQRALNVLNNQGKDYPDIAVDGAVGKMTIHCLKTYLAKRGELGETVLLRLVNGQQSVKYMEFAEARSSQEKFEFGWLAQRVDGDFE